MSLERSDGIMKSTNLFSRDHKISPMFVFTWGSSCLDPESWDPCDRSVLLLHPSLELSISLCLCAKATSFWLRPTLCLTDSELCQIHDTERRRWRWSLQRWLTRHCHSVRDWRKFLPRFVVSTPISKSINAKIMQNTGSDVHTSFLNWTEEKQILCKRNSLDNSVSPYAATIFRNVSCLSRIRFSMSSRARTSRLREIQY